MSHKDLWLLFTGDGPLRDELKDLAQTFNMSGQHESFWAMWRMSARFCERVTFTYCQAMKKVSELRSIEAMACELVCVATKTIGPCEIIENGRNGFLTERTYEGVLTGLYQALKLGEKERATIGNCARQRV